MVSAICIIASIQTTFIGYHIFQKYKHDIIPNMLSWYATAYDIFQKGLKQTSKISQAVMNSFLEDGLFFYEDEISKLPSVYASQIVKPSWIYRDDCFTSTSSSNNTKKHIPYLSSELTNGQTKYFLSEWMETIRFCSDTLPPLRILITSWAVDTNQQIDLFNKEHPWIFNVITQEGDELSYNVLTGAAVESAETT